MLPIHAAPPNGACAPEDIVRCGSLFVVGPAWTSRFPQHVVFSFGKSFTYPAQTGLLQIAVGSATAAIVWKSRAWPRVDQLCNRVSACGRCWVSGVPAKPGVLCWQQTAGNWLFPHPMGNTCVFWLLTLMCMALKVPYNTRVVVYLVPNLYLGKRC